MEVWHRQQLGLARLKPGLRRRPLALGAVPVTARVIGDAGVRAVLAPLDMTTKLRRAAGLDRRHDTELAMAHMTGVAGAPRLSAAAEDIRHLKLRVGHVRRAMPGEPTPASGLLAGSRPAGS